MGDPAALDRVGERLAPSRPGRSARRRSAGDICARARGTARPRRASREHVREVEAEAGRDSSGSWRSVRPISPVIARGAPAIYWTGSRLLARADGRWEPERPGTKSLWLLPSGSDQVGDSPVRPTPAAHMVDTLDCRKLAASASIQFAPPARRCARSAFPASSVSMIWQASREVRVTCAARSSRSSSSSLAARQPVEIRPRRRSRGRSSRPSRPRTRLRAAGRSPRRRRAAADPAFASTSLSSVPSALRKPHLESRGEPLLGAGGRVDAAAGVDQLFLVGVAAEAEADRRARLAVGEAERAQHMARASRSAGAGRPERESDVAQVGDQPRARRARRGGC